MYKTPTVLQLHAYGIALVRSANMESRQVDGTPENDGVGLRNDAPPVSLVHRSARCTERPTRMDTTDGHLKTKKPRKKGEGISLACLVT